MAPGLYYTDSGELAAACATWGVAHPTGYPLYTLVGHIITLLPFGTPIVLLNVFAALCCAAGCGIMAFLAMSLVGRVNSSLSENTIVVIGATSALLLGASVALWAQATQTEVYSLNFMLLCATLLSVERSSAVPEKFHSLSALSGFLFGLMLCNHLSSVFLAPGLILLWSAGSTLKTRLRSILWVVIPATLALTLYALLPMRSAQLPPINWGWVHRDFASFWYHVRGTQFGIWLFTDKTVLKTNFTIFSQLAGNATLYIALVMSGIGLILLNKKNKFLAGGFLVLMLGNLGISLGYGIPDIEPYFLPSITTLLLLVAVGLTSIASKLKGKLLYALWLLPIVSVAMNYQTMDKHQHTVVNDYAEWVLENAEPNAIIITRQWDYMCAALWYKQVVDHYRTDVTVIDKELLRRTWYARYLKQLYPKVLTQIQPEVDLYMNYLREFEADGDAFMKQPDNTRAIQERFVQMLNALLDKNPNRPIYVTPEILNEEQGFAQGYNGYPQGPLYRLTTSVTKPPATRTIWLSSLATGLVVPQERLDSGLQSVTLNAVTNSALFELEGRADTNAFRSLRSVAMKINNRSQAARMLNERLP